MGVLPPLSRALDRAGYGAACLALALLPLQGFGSRPLRPFASLIAFDALLGLVLVLSLVRLVRHVPRLLAVPAGWFSLSLAAAGLVSELAQMQPRLGPRLLEQLAPLLAAAAISAHASVRERRRGLLQAALLGGALALGLALGGYTVDVVRGTHQFASSGSHPIFDGLPRLVATFGGSAQRAGNFAVYLLALALAAQDVAQRLVRRVAGALALAALVLSMSFAWLGGAALAALVLPERWRRLGLGLLVLALLVASVPLLRGPESAAREGDCQALDAEHYLVVPRAPGQCLRLSDGGRAITRYAEAKRAALAGFVEAPLFGVGYRGFAAFSDRAFAEQYAHEGEHYEQPHGLVPGLAAKHGLLGALLVPLWLWLLYRGWRNSPYDFAVVAFLVIGLYGDVDRLRELWVLWGLMAADQGAKEPRGPGVEGLSRP
jgi:hypothetical protein